MKRVIELIRVSTEGQAAEDRASIPAQRAVNRHTAQQYGLEIIKSIEMSDVSGTAVLLAPEMRQLLKAIESPDIQGVVAREFSRLMRPENFSDYALLQAFADTHTILYLPDGPIDLGSKTGRLLGGVRALFAGLERSEIIERSWTAKEAMRRRGELAQSSSCLPWGVGYKDGKFFYKPEAERVREAFRRLLAGEHRYQVLRGICGVSTPGIRSILKNPIWTGWRVIDQKREATPRPRPDGRQGDKRKVARAPDEIIRIKVIADPLISETDFQRAQQIMAAKAQHHWGFRPEAASAPHFIYGGFLTCAECGQQVRVNRSHKDDYYICKGRLWPNRGCRSPYMRRDRLEPHLDDVLCEHLTDRGFLAEILAELTRGRTGDGVALRRLQAAASKLKAKRDRVLDAYLEAIIPRDERDRRLAQINAEAERVQQLLLQQAPVLGPEVTPQYLAEAFQPFSEWKFLSRADKRLMLATMVPDIHVRGYQVAGISIFRSAEESRRLADS